MNTGTRNKIYDFIFESDSPSGKDFDVFLLIIIVISIAAVMLESITGIQLQFGEELYILEWVITFFFTIEYFLRIWVIKRASKYIFSFYGIIDLLAILPSFIGIFLAGAQGLLLIRGIRLLRIFRLFKLTRYTSEADTLLRAMKASKTKISVFLFAVFTIVIVIGTLMYLVEGGEHGFTSIPKGIYWAVVTLTTVGYGDIAPVTNLGQFIASLVMILGYGIIAVPTGIVTAEMTKIKFSKTTKALVCPNCLKEDHDPEAKYCKHCGEKLDN